MSLIINCNDILSILNEFIIDLKTILSLRHTCKTTMRKKFYVMINKLKKNNSQCNVFKYELNKPYIHNMFKVIYINELPFYFNDSYIVHFKYLIHLDSSFTNKITDESIQHLTNISILNCNNVFTDWSLMRLTNLVSLDLKDNSLIGDFSLQCLTKLKKLFLSEYSHKISDKSIELLTNLTNLHLGCNKVNYITSESINKLTNLTSLNITGNEYIDSIKLPNLKSLYANQLITDSSVLCEKITHLHCVDNEKLTDSILYTFPNLIYLSCGYNDNFTDDILYNLPNLTYLNCGFNLRFTDIGLSTLTNLKTLQCGYNSNFTDKSLPYLINLIFLTCGSNNNFTARGILNLINLEELVCSYGRNGVNFTDLKPLKRLKKINGINFRK